MPERSIGAVLKTGSAAIARSPLRSADIPLRLPSALAEINADAVSPLESACSRSRLDAGAPYGAP